MLETVLVVVVVVPPTIWVAPVVTVPVFPAVMFTNLLVELEVVLVAPICL